MARFKFTKDKRWQELVGLAWLGSWLVSSKPPCSESSAKLTKVFAFLIDQTNQWMEMNVRPPPLSSFQGNQVARETRLWVILRSFEDTVYPDLSEHARSASSIG